MLVYGGRRDPTGSTTIPHYDLWSYDLVSSGGWQNLAHTETQIEIRSSHQAVYDSLRDRMIVLPGTGDYNSPQTMLLGYTLATSSWAILSDRSPTIGNYDHTVGAYDPGHDRIVMFTGHDLTGSGTNFVSVLSLTAPDGARPPPAGRRRDARMASLRFTIR